MVAPSLTNRRASDPAVQRILEALHQLKSGEFLLHTRIAELCDKPTFDGFCRYCYSRAAETAKESSIFMKTVHGAGYQRCVGIEYVHRQSEKLRRNVRGIAHCTANMSLVRDGHLANDAEREVRNFAVSVGSEMLGTMASKCKALPELFVKTQVNPHLSAAQIRKLLSAEAAA